MKYCDIQDIFCIINSQSFKMEKTESERLFEHYCKSKGIIYRRIPETKTRTPDYELEVGNERIVAEVKEIMSSKGEQGYELLRSRRGYGNALDYTPGDRVRKKTKNSSGQIKACTQGKNPSILVVFVCLAIFPICMNHESGALGSPNSSLYFSVCLNPFSKDSSCGLNINHISSRFF